MIQIGRRPDHDVNEPLGLLSDCHRRIEHFLDVLIALDRHAAGGSLTPGQRDGHAIGIACGYGALWLFGLQHAPPAMATGVSAARIGAAALSLAATGALMILFKAAHPPAGATTLIISLGIVTQPFHLLVIEIAVAILTLQAIVINRLAGIDYPLWALREGPR